MPGEKEKKSCWWFAAILLLAVLMALLASFTFTLGICRIDDRRNNLLATVPLVQTGDWINHEMTAVDPKELAKEVLEILGKVAMDAKTVIEWLDKLEHLGNFMDVISSVLDLIDPSRDPFQEKFLEELALMNIGIDHIRRDIKALRDDIQLEFEKAKMDAYLQKISMAVYLAKEGTHEELRRHCTKLVINNTYDTLDCFEPLKTVTEKVPALLDAFYASTQGDLPKISGVTRRLLGLVLAGEVIVQNLAKELPVSDRYDVGKRLSSYVNVMKESFNDVTDQCIDQFEKNMAQDIEDVLALGGSNEDSKKLLRSRLGPKYGWRYLGILVYNNVATGNNHWNWGDQFVDVYHKYDKNVVVYYRDKSRNQTFATKACNMSDFQYFVACNTEFWKAKDMSTWTLGEDFDYWKSYGKCKGMESAQDCKERGKTTCNSHFGFCDGLYALAYVHKSANLVYSIDKEMEAVVVAGNDYKYASTGIAFPL